MKYMIDYLYEAAMEAKEELLLRRKRFSKQKKLAENNINVPSQFQPMSREDVLNHERSLKKPMVSDDGEQERPQKKVRLFGQNFPQKAPGVHDSGKNPFLESKGKLNYNAADDKKREKPEKSEKKRKRKDSSFGSVKQPIAPLPENVRRKIVEKAGEEDVRIVLVIQKVLERSDVLRQQNRVTIPLAQVDTVFLTPREELALGEKIGAHYNYMIVPIIEPSGSVGQVHLRRWNVGKRSVSYVLNGDWKHVVEYNHLQENQTVQLWAFWVQDILNFAFVVLPDQEGDKSASKALAVLEHPPQRRFDEAPTSTAKPHQSSTFRDELVSSPSDSASEVVTATSENEGEGEDENSSPGSEDSELRFDLNMMPEPEAE